MPTQKYYQRSKNLTTTKKENKTAVDANEMTKQH
jgi:hypothetical protein